MEFYENFSEMFFGNNDLGDIKDEELEKCKDILRSGNIPPKAPGVMRDNPDEPLSNLSSMMNISLFRRGYVKEFGYILPTEEWIAPLSLLIGKSKCLEVMSGKGLLTKALMNFGVNCLATDNKSWDGKEGGIFGANWFDPNSALVDVEKIDALDAIKKYGHDIDYIIVSWPPMDELCTECLKLMRTINPNSKMIYIGENGGGCTASDSFFELANIIDCPLVDEANLNFPRFGGIYDRIYLIN